MGKKENAVTDLFHLIHIMRRPENADTFLAGNFLYLTSHFTGGGGIEGGGWLIEKEELRPVKHCLRERDPGLFAGGEHAAFRTAELLEIKLVEEFLDAPGKIADGVQEPEDTEILFDGQVTGKRGIRGSEIRKGKRPGPVGSDIAPQDFNRTGGGFQDTENHTDRCGFSGTIGTEKAHDLIGPHHKRNAIYGSNRAETLAKVNDRKHNRLRWHWLMLFFVNAVVNLDGPVQARWNYFR